MTKRQRTIKLIILFTLLILSIVLILIGQHRGKTFHNNCENFDLNGNCVIPEMTQDLIQFMEEIAPTPEAIIEEVVVSPEIGRFMVPSLDLNVAFRTMTVSAVIDPPDYVSVFEVLGLNSYGLEIPESSVFLATHALSRGGHAPGNYLVNDNDEATLQPGDEIFVNGVVYEFTHAISMSKTDLPFSQEVWNNDPNRLVIITCVPRDNGRAVDNIILFGRLAANQDAEHIQELLSAY